MTNRFTVLGAGIAGMTTAIILAQKGYSVRLFERDAGSVVNPGMSGAGMVLWPNASFVLDQLGILPLLMERGGELEKMYRVSDTGESLGSINIKRLNQLMGYPSYSVFRRDFYDILRHKLESLKVDVNFGYTLQSITNVSNDHVSLNFDNGRVIEVLAPELVIGADGRMRSMAREYVQGDNSPVYQGFVNWIGLLEGTQDLLDELSVLDIWGTGLRFGIVPVSKNRVYWAAAASMDRFQDENSTGTCKTELSEKFKDWPEPAVEIIRQVNDSQIHKLYVHDHNPVKTWHKDNVILLGDCAHAALPTSGQGACQALEDAWHFGQVLGVYNDWKTVFSEFNELRRDKTARIISAARSFANDLFNTEADYCQQRNERSKLTDYNRVADGMAAAWGQGLPLTSIGNIGD